VHRVLIPAPEMHHPKKLGFDQVRARASPVRVNLPKSLAVSTGLKVVSMTQGQGARFRQLQPATE
jgi:hypothetical protein